MKRLPLRLIFWSMVLVSSTITPASASDWPQWRGPNRDGISTETGLLSDWRAAPPRLLWQKTGLGSGYASVAIVGDRLYTMGDREGQQMVIAIDLATRRELWATPIGQIWTNRGGARCTPTIDGDRLYAIGTHGDLVCLETATGKVIWRKNFQRDFGGRMMSGWGYSESPLVDGQRLVCTPGARDAMIVALNKATGETIWRSAVPALGGAGPEGAGYSSIVVAEAAGVRQYVQVIGRGAIGVRADDGRFLWSYTRIANRTANIPTPIVKGDIVFVSTGYQTGSAALRLVAADGGVRAQELWFLDGNTFQNHHGGVVLVGDYLYAGHGHNNGIPICVELATGKVMWRAPRSPGSGSASVAYADGNIYMRHENGQMTLVAATPQSYEVRGSFRLAHVDGPSWPHPVIHDGKLYLRSENVLMCYDVSGR
jgi:outer membrane protein assembly factor BamB